jgi:hypothetical protein
MPVVRIVGSVPEGFCDLPQQLSDRGFDVETVSDNANCEPGTLEITVEECSTEEALGRVLSLAQGNDIAILVSPGAISPVSPVSDSKKDQIPSATDVPVSVPGNISPAPAESIEAPAHVQEPEPAYLASETHFEAPLEPATQLTAHAESLNQGEESPVTDEPGTLPVDGTEPPFWPVMEQQDEPASLPAAEWVESEPPAALPLNAEEDSDWPIWQVASQDEQTPPSEVELPQPESPISTEHVAALYSLGRRFLAAQVNRILLDDRLFTRIAVSSAAMAILLLVVGGTAHRFSPLPSRILHESTEAAQPVPFRRPGAASAPITASEAVPADAPEPATLGVTPALVHSRGRRSFKPTPRSSHTSSSGDAGFVAKDTVVRFNQRPSEPLPQTAKKQPGIKYYTDLKQ